MTVKEFVKIGQYLTTLWAWERAVRPAKYAMHTHMHIFKVWRHIKNPTKSDDTHLLEEQRRKISSGSDFKRRSIRLFWRAFPNNKNNNNKNKMISDIAYSIISWSKKPQIYKSSIFQNYILDCEVMSNENAVVESASFLFRSLYLPHEVRHWLYISKFTRLRAVSWRQQGSYYLGHVVLR